MRVLLVEDDDLVGGGLQKGLQKSGFAAEWVRTAGDAESAMLTDNFDCVILDIGLPKVSGLDLLKTMREKKVTTPVLLLTARETVSDRVKGLDSGADDYMVKPFSLEEVAARIRALVRRSHGRAEPTLQYEGVCLWPESLRVALNDETMDIRGKEFKILQYLLENKGRVVSRENLESLLYGWDGQIESNSVEVHIHNLRKKLGKDFIKTHRGSGYTVG